MAVLCHPEIRESGHKFSSGLCGGGVDGGHARSGRGAADGRDRTRVGRGHDRGEGGRRDHERERGRGNERGGFGDSRWGETGEAEEERRRRRRSQGERRRKGRTSCLSKFVCFFVCLLCPNSPLYFYMCIFFF